MRSIAAIGTVLLGLPITSQDRVLTVCEALENRLALDGKTVTIRGIASGTWEGRWFLGECDSKLTTQGYTWPDCIWLETRDDEYPRLGVKPDRRNLDSFFDQVNPRRRSRTMGYQARATLRGVLETFEDLGSRVRQYPDGRPVGSGYGHVGAAPVRLVLLSASLKDVEVLSPR